MYTPIKQNQLEFRVNFKVEKKVKEGFLGFNSKTEEQIILNDGEKFN